MNKYYYYYYYFFGKHINTYYELSNLQFLIISLLSICFHFSDFLVWNIKFRTIITN